MDISDHNIIFITLDSCTYESALSAQTKNLDFLGEMRRAETHGTYTYPAHHAFFIGNLPNILDDNKSYLENYSQVWRSTAARKSTGGDIGIYFDGENILEYYQKRGFNVVGCGGVSFFNTNNPNNGLPKLFKEFIYFGDSKTVPRDQGIPRNQKSFPLNNIDEIVSRVKNGSPYFLFINCPETHIPYDYPGCSVSSEYKALILRLYQEHDLKLTYAQNELPLSKEEISLIKQHQVKALEWIDSQLGILFAKLTDSRKTLVIVCADHGEEFGEGGRFGHFHAHKTIFEVPLWIGII